MVAKSKSGKKPSKIKVGKLKAKGRAKDLTASEAKKVRGGVTAVSDVKEQKVV